MKVAKVVIAIVAIGIALWIVFNRFQTRLTASLNNDAFALLGQEKFAEARDLLEQARTRDPNNPAIWKNLGAAYQGLKNLPKAIEAYERSLALNSNQLELRDAVAALKKEVEQAEEKP